MFIIKKYKMFESNFSDDDIKLAEEIESKQRYIEEEFELKVEHRKPFGDTHTKLTGSRYFDISKKIGTLYSIIGVYDILEREFILFYSEGKQLTWSNYIRIKSKNFFDELERIHYLIYIED